KLFIKYFSEEIYTLAKSIINAPSFDLVKYILNTIKSSDEAGAKDWANYYETPWIILLLNINMSKMEHQIWRKYKNNTNVAEAAHTLVNKKQAKLRKELAEAEAIELQNRQLKI
ncbi:39562_t:CDS:2, partial [Gigaspora margarita]